MVDMVNRPDNILRTPKRQRQKSQPQVRLRPPKRHHPLHQKHNNDPKSFVWTKSASEILTKLQRVQLNPLFDSCTSRRRAASNADAPTIDNQLRSYHEA